MRRGSIIGPLILIGIGVLFLLRNVWPDIPVLQYLARYWPFLLIAWGVIRLVEILVLAVQSKPLPSEGISGGEWVLVILICLLGALIHSGNLNRFPRFRNLRIIEKPCPKNCRVVIESFNGNARITGTNDQVVRASGVEDMRLIDPISKATPLDLVAQGDEIIVRANQYRASGWVRDYSSLKITVPMDSSVEAHSRWGDFDVENVNGPVNLTSDRPGMVQLKNLAQPVRYQDPRFTLQVGGIPGDARIATGDFTANDITGPIILNARSRDIHLSRFTQSLQVTLQRGDVVLHPGENVPQMDVHTGSGNIELAIPAGAKFDLRASTDRGEVHNEYGAPLNVNISAHGGEIVGNLGGGPPVHLESSRGAIRVSLENSGLPHSLDQPLQVERQ